MFHGHTQCYRRSVSQDIQASPSCLWLNISNCITDDRIFIRSWHLTTSRDFIDQYRESTFIVLSHMYRLKSGGQRIEFSGHRQRMGSPFHTGAAGPFNFKARVSCSAVVQVLYSSNASGQGGIISSKTFSTVRALLRKWVYLCAIKRWNAYKRLFHMNIVF